MVKAILVGILTGVLASALAGLSMLAHIPRLPVDINVRWAAAVAESDRNAAEQRFGLASGARRDETTWTYQLTDRSAGNIRALVADARVEDTQNLNRDTFQPVETPWNVTAIALRGLALGIVATVFAFAASRAVSVRRFWILLVGAWVALGARAASGSPAPVAAMGAALLLAATGALPWGNAASSVWRRRAFFVQRAAAFAAQERSVITMTACLVLVVLVLTAGNQIYDAQHFLLGPATAILAGDRPYRDFYDTGVPLASYMAAAFQRLSGHRLIGEFVRQWIFIVAGVALAVRLGLRLSRSPAATLATLPLILFVLAGTPTYHESKLFFFPLMTWAAWAYIEQPSTGRAVVVSLVTALGFLSRHDYGIYLGFASVVAFVLARLAVPTARRLGAMGTEIAAYAAVIAVVLAPWVIAVETGEGLLDYTRSRLALNQPAPRDHFIGWLTTNPIRLLLPARSPAPRMSRVTFSWDESIHEARQRELEDIFHLRPIGGPDADQLRRYELPNLYDQALLELEPLVHNSAGFDWDRLRDVEEGFPPRDNAERWLMDMGMLVPLALMTAALRRTWAARRRRVATPPDVWLMAFAATFIGVLELGLLREPSYVAVVAPLAAALSARFLVAGNRLRQAVAITALALTTYAAAIPVRDSNLFVSPIAMGRSTLDTLARLTQLPPRYDDTLTYLQRCTAPGDRLLVTGTTPLHLSYYAQRPIAGGHIMWHYGWRADPAHEGQSLALLHRQSVPFAVSTSDRVRDDFKKYPSISAYLEQHYAEVDGTKGLLLVDTRRQPVGRYGERGLPCFR